jgi:hypothetical protein
MSGTSTSPVPWNSPQALITYFTLTLVVACLAAAYAKGDQGTIQLVVGAVLGWAGASITFWVGSSHSSQTKDAVIATMTPPSNTNTGTTP